MHSKSIGAFISLLYLSKLCMYMPARECIQVLLLIVTSSQSIDGHFSSLITLSYLS